MSQNFCLPFFIVRTKDFVYEFIFLEIKLFEVKY